MGTANKTQIGSDPLERAAGPDRRDIRDSEPARRSAEDESRISDLFRSNLDQYQTTINQLIFISYVACGIWSIALFALSDLFGILSIPTGKIIQFSALTALDLAVMAVVMIWAGRSRMPSDSINIFKYSLLFCAAMNYFWLILFIPYREIWLTAFFFIFLSTLFFDFKAVLFISGCIFLAGLAAFGYQPVFRPENQQELLIRTLNFAFAVFAALVTSVVSRRLFRQTAEKEYELSVSMENIERRREVAEGLRDMLAVLNSERSLEEVLEFIVSEAMRIVDTDACALYKIDLEKNTLSVEMTKGLPEDFVTMKEYPAEYGPMGTAAIERKPVHITDFGDLFQRYGELGAYLNRTQWARDNLTSMLAVPLVCKNEVYGGISFFFKKCDVKDIERCCFTDEKIKLAAAFADQAALAIDNARLREETQEVAVAAERNRLARDLHDAVTQTLFSASLIAEVLPAIWEKNQDEGRKRLVEIKELSRGALAEMRALLLELRPTTLLETNLSDLLKHLSEAAIGRGRIPISLDYRLNGHLPVDVKIAFYRIAQEAVNNIVKHSVATEGAIELTETTDDQGGRSVRMEIRDNGRGFDDSLVESDHIGLNIMKERAAAIGAELRVGSRPGHGTAVAIVWKERSIKDLSGELS